MVSSYDWHFHILHNRQTRKITGKQDSNYCLRECYLASWSTGCFLFPPSLTEWSRGRQSINYNPPSFYSISLALLLSEGGDTWEIHLISPSGNSSWRWFSILHSYSHHGRDCSVHHLSYLNSKSACLQCSATNYSEEYKLNCGDCPPSTAQSVRARKMLEFCLIMGLSHICMTFHSVTTARCHYLLVQSFWLLMEDR